LKYFEERPALWPLLLMLVVSCYTVGLDRLADGFDARLPRHHERVPVAHVATPVHFFRWTLEAGWIIRINPLTHGRAAILPAKWRCRFRSFATPATLDIAGVRGFAADCWIAGKRTTGDLL
jgi:hypothetical protein